MTQYHHGSTITALYWSSATKYQQVEPHTDPVPSCINQYRLLLTQYYQVPTGTAFYWTNTIIYQPVTSTAPYWPSATKYQSMLTYTDPVSSYINQCRLPLTQYRQVPTSTTPYWPGTTKYQPFPTYTVVAWGLQTPAQFTLGLVSHWIRASRADSIKTSF